GAARAWTPGCADRENRARPRADAAAPRDARAAAQRNRRHAAGLEDDGDHAACRGCEPRRHRAPAAHLAECREAAPGPRPPTPARPADQPRLRTKRRAAMRPFSRGEFLGALLFCGVLPLITIISGDDCLSPSRALNVGRTPIAPMIAMVATRSSCAAPIRWRRGRRRSRGGTALPRSREW